MYSNFFKQSVPLRGLVIAATFAAVPAMAHACPDADLSSAELVYTADELWSGESFEVLAGGDENLEYCPEIGEIGFVAENADFELDLTDVAGYSITFRVVAECDTVLLINTADGDWVYDDDGGGEIDPEITLNPSEGIFDIWVGSFEQETCPASLHVETYDRGDV